MNKIASILIFVFLFASTVFAADSLTGNTWTFDSTGPKTPASFQAVWIWWTGIVTDGDSIAIHEYPSGNLIWKAKGKAGFDIGVPFFGSSGKMDGIEVRTLSSGVVQVRLGQY
jgi:hypothetical protein